MDATLGLSLSQFGVMRVVLPLNHIFVFFLQSVVWLTDNNRGMPNSVAAFLTLSQLFQTLLVAINVSAENVLPKLSRFLLY